MIEVLVASGVAVAVGAAWTLAVYQYARRNTVQKNDYEQLKLAHDAVSDFTTKMTAELSMIKEQLAQRSRKLEMRDADYHELDCKFNANVAKQALDSSTISDLINENASLKQVIESLKSVAPTRKRSTKVG